jgi:hypothetical protein
VSGLVRSFQAFPCQAAEVHFLVWELPQDLLDVVEVHHSALTKVNCSNCGSPERLTKERQFTEKRARLEDVQRNFIGTNAGHHHYRSRLQKVHEVAFITLMYDDVTFFKGHKF